MSEIVRLRGRVDAALADYGFAARSVVAEESAGAEARLRLDVAAKAQKIIQEFAQAFQQNAHEHVSTIVTRCIQTVFGDEYAFRILFEQKRGKTEARLCFYHDDNEVDPIEGSAGGMVDVAAFGLRLACLILSVPAKRRLLVLDEPMKMVSRDHAHKLKQLIEILSSELEIQFIIVTHDPNLVAGKVISL